MFSILLFVVLPFILNAYDCLPETDDGFSESLIPNMNHSHIVLYDSSTQHIAILQIELIGHCISNDGLTIITLYECFIGNFNNAYEII